MDTCRYGLEWIPVGIWQNGYLEVWVRMDTCMYGLECHLFVCVRMDTERSTTIVYMCMCVCVRVCVPVGGDYWVHVTWVAL